MGTLKVVVRRAGVCLFAVDDLAGGAILLGGGADLESDLLAREVRYPSGNEAVLSEAVSRGLRPMHALLGSIVVCGALDVLSILAKQREPLVDLVVEAEGDRPEAVPAPFARIRILLRTESDVEPRRFEHAAQLAYEKYCSVGASLSGEISVEVSTRVREHDTLNRS